MATDAAIVLPLSPDGVAQAEQKADGTAEAEGSEWAAAVGSGKCVCGSVKAKQMGFEQGSLQG